MSLDEPRDSEASPSPFEATGLLEIDSTDADSAIDDMGQM